MSVMKINSRGTRRGIITKREDRDLNYGEYRNFKRI